MGNSRADAAAPDHAQLLAEAERRWAALETVRPELAAALALQRRLVERSLALTAAIAHLPLPTVDDAAGRLRARRPILSGAALLSDGAPFKPFVVGFCDDLAQGGAGQPAERARDALARGAIDIGSLLGASLRRHQNAIRLKANQVGIAPDVLWLAAELGAAPLAAMLQRAWLQDAPAADPALRAALADWDDGCCPACGSWPALAETVAGERRLRCSFCAGSWELPDPRCIYCGESGDALLSAALPDAGGQPRRVELCRACGGYLKHLETERRTPFALLPVADLESSDLDASAVERGYIRFSMREVDAA